MYRCMYKYTKAGEGYSVSFSCLLILLVLGLKTQADMPGFLCGCWRFELRPSCLRNKRLPTEPSYCPQEGFYQLKNSRTSNSYSMMTLIKEEWGNYNIHIE